MTDNPLKPAPNQKPPTEAQAQGMFKRLLEIHCREQGKTIKSITVTRKPDSA